MIPIFEKNEVCNKAEEYGRKLAANGHCTIEKDNNYCIVFKAAARTRFNIFLPGMIITGRELTVYKDGKNLHLDESFITVEYLLEQGGLHPLMNLEVAAL